MDRSVRESWDDASDAWIDFVRTGKDICRDYLNNPAMFELLEDVSGKRLLDLGCGEGYNTRLMARKGAEVVGVDFSEKMIRLAREEETKEPLGIKYHLSDAARLDMLGDECIDIISCFMVYQDFEDVESVTGEVARVLKEDGYVVISMPHPCFDMNVEQGAKTSGWIYERMDDPEDRGEPLYVIQTDYFKTGRTTTVWNMPRLEKQFVTPHFRRTLTEYVNTLGRHGLYISDLIEPKPTKEGLEKFPEFAKLLRVPQSIIFKAVKKDQPKS
jgi:ubiquinone/menaquinone biosynthesis C-methylase UbiE